MNYRDRAEFVNRRLDREDAKIRRCQCGGWVYGDRPCRTCPLFTTCAQTDAGRPGDSDRDAFLEDLEWILDTGETHIERIAARVNVTPGALVTRLRRCGRLDLARRMDHVHAATRQKVAA